MSTEAELKRKLGSMLGASMLATTLSAVPASFDPTNLSIKGSYAFAESGNSGSGEGGDSDSDGDSESGEGGESGSGGESGDNSGSGESGSGESGENSGSGSSGESSGPGNSGSKNSGKKSQGGFFKNFFFRNERASSKKSRHSTSRSIPSRFGRVVRSRTSRRGAEVKYSDGWSEKIRDGRYQLVNPTGRVVVSRRARNSDRSRLKTAAKK